MKVATTEQDTYLLVDQAPQKENPQTPQKEDSDMDTLAFLFWLLIAFIILFF